MRVIKMIVMNKMKKNLFYALCLLLGIAAFTACSDDKAEPSVNPGGGISGITNQDLADIQVVDSGKTSWHDHYAAILKEAQQGNGEEDSLMVAYASRQLEVNDSLTNAYLESIGANGELPGADGNWSKDYFLGYKYVVLKYKTIDKDGNPIECSELVIGPSAPFDVGPAPQPNHLVIGCHDAITSDAQCPSKGIGYEAYDVGTLIEHARANFKTGVNNNLVIIPDYQGYGATRKDAHPYLSQDLTARQVLDGVIAGKKWYEENAEPLNKDFKTIAVGYSQGGATAMAVQRYIEKNNLSETLNFAGSVCGNGLYNPEATLKSYISNDKIYMPLAVAQLIKGMCDAAPGMAGQYAPSDYLTEGFLKSGILDWLASKDYTEDEIQDKLQAYASNKENGFEMTKDAANDASSYCTASEVLRPEVIAYFKNGSVETPYMAKMTALHDALEQNNLSQGWQPQHPIFVFHSEKDEVVPLVNYEKVELAFSPTSFFRGIINKSSVANHKNTRTIFYLVKEGFYFKSILSDTWEKDYPDHKIYE